MSYALVNVCSRAEDSLTPVQFVTMCLALAGNKLTEEKRGSSKNFSQKDALSLQELVKRSQEGDLEAMEAIYRQFNRPLFKLVYCYTSNREAAEDLLQEIFVKVFTRIKDLRREGTLVGWIYRIAINTCYSYLRENKIQLQKAIPLGKVENVINGRTPSSSKGIVRRSLDKAIQSLPRKMRAVFLLHDVQGFKHKEIASMMECSVGTSKSQLFKARMKIREHLECKEA